MAVFGQKVHFTWRKKVFFVWILSATKL